MMKQVNNIEEDEDVVIQGSALHEHLLKLGYTDFESVSMPKKTYFEDKFYSNIDIRSTVKKIYAKLFTLYSWITQEKSISKKQLNVILNAKFLLNDHLSTIHNLVAKCDDVSKKLTPQELIVTGVVLIPARYISRLIRKHKILRTLFASSAICCAGYIKYSRFCANTDLKNVISLQNELFALCKEGLKILRRDYKIKVEFDKCPRQFSFVGTKLRYVPQLIDNLLLFMVNASCKYYQCSLSIAKLLPPNMLNEELFTKFESSSFQITEMSFRTVKDMYHLYLLVQSEMIYLLAIAYDSDTWINSCQKIPERKLARTIRALINDLMMHKDILSNCINNYRACKPEPFRYRAQDGAKWHDPTVQLDLASYKLQLAYNQVFSIFQDIDDYISREIAIDDETADVLMQKLDTVFKDIDTAKNLAEFVVLLMARSESRNLKGDRPAIDGVADIDENPDLPMIMDSDPEILDEVFEEYVNEEYSKSSCEEMDEYTLEQQRLDKVLAKSFMSELKEALVDKHKSMSERESKALQRVYKNISKDSALNAETDVNCQFVPAPPPMPSSYVVWSTPSSNMSHKETTSPVCKIENVGSRVREKFDESGEENELVRALRCKDSLDTSSTKVGDDRDEDSFSSLPQILLETQVTRFVTRPPVVLQEEIFAGSGENSEDEVVDSASDNDEDNEKNSR